MLRFSSEEKIPLEREKPGGIWPANCTVFFFALLCFLYVNQITASFCPFTYLLVEKEKWIGSRMMTGERMMVVVVTTGFHILFWVGGGKRDVFYEMGRIVRTDFVGGRYFSELLARFGHRFCGRGDIFRN